MSDMPHLAEYTQQYKAEMPLDLCQKNWKMTRGLMACTRGGTLLGIWEKAPAI